MAIILIDIFSDLISIMFDRARSGSGFTKSDIRPRVLPTFGDGLIEDKRGGSITIDRREEILAVAARLFRERGYTSTSLDDITGEIGITKPAIYYYFKAKEDILFEICLMHINNITRNGQAIAESDLSIEDKVAKMFEGAVMQYHNNRDIAEAYLREAAHLSLERRKVISNMLKKQEYLIRDHVDMGIKAGVFRPINSKHVVRGVGGMVNWLGNWYDPQGPDDIHVIVTAYVDFIMHGLMAADASKYRDQSMVVSG